MRSNPFQLVIVLLAAIGVAVFASAHAGAQMAFSGGFGGIGAAERLNSSDIEKLKEILDLDEGQQLVLDDLFAAYQADVEAARTEIRQIQEAVEKEFDRSNDMAVWREARDKFTSYSNYVDRLRQRMIDDLKLVLREDQLPGFDEFERYKRRSQRLDNNFPPIHGAGVDLIEMVGKMELSGEAREAIDPILYRYEMDLDRFFLDNDLEQILRDEFGDLDEFDIMQRMNDPMEIARIMGRASAMMNKLRGLSRQIRDINERTLRQIMGAVPEETAAELETEFRREVFPEIYSDTEAQGIMRTVAEFDDLSDEQRASLDEIREGFDRELKRLNSAWAAALRAQDDKEQEGLFSMMRFGDQPELVKRILSDRTDLESSTIERVREMLTPTQAQRLPGAEIIDWRSMGNWDDME
ncbi:MAG: hypothetical protein ACTS3F_08655 [Phycisphaerales bacterium]